MNNQKGFCYNLVKKSLQKGLLKKPKYCSKCKAIGKLHAHHFDYSKPLDVIWLCSSCHNHIHYIPEKCPFVQPKFLKMLSKRSQGNKYAKGSIRLKEFKEGVSKFHKGKAHFKGKKHTIEERKKISDSAKLMWRNRKLINWKMPESWKNQDRFKMSNRMKKLWENRRLNDWVRPMQWKKGGRKGWKHTDAAKLKIGESSKKRQKIK